MKRLAFYAFVGVMLLASGTVFAKNINLYADPKTDSKVTGTVNPETGITIV